MGCGGYILCEWVVEGTLVDGRHVASDHVELVHVLRDERIFIKRMTSDRELQASKEGSKGRIYGT